MDPRRLIAPAVAAVVAVALAILAPEIYTGTFSDLGTLLRVAAFAVGLGLWFAAMRRWVRPPGLALGLGVVPIVVFTWIYVWPYLRPPTEVDEAFPSTAVDLPPAQSTAELPSTTTGPTPATAPATTASTATTAFAATTAPPAAADEPPATTTATTTTSTTSTTTTTATTMPVGPVELRRATFQGLTGHRGSGDAAVYRLEDGSILLRFEDVDIGSGPDLDVYLVTGEDRRGPGDGTYVADLTAERGNQNYTVPAGVDLTVGTWTVLVWCETFDVEVANATLA